MWGPDDSQCNLNLADKQEFAAFTRANALSKTFLILALGCIAAALALPH